jgi:hypothetical protein
MKALTWNIRGMGKNPEWGSLKISFLKREWTLWGCRKPSNKASLIKIFLTSLRGLPSNGTGSL